MGQDHPGMVPTPLQPHPGISPGARMEFGNIQLHLTSPDLTSGAALGGAAWAVPCTDPPDHPWGPPNIHHALSSLTLCHGHDAQTLAGH